MIVVVVGQMVEEQEDWRQSLTVGSMCDALQQGGDAKKQQPWFQAMVMAHRRGQQNGGSGSSSSSSAVVAEEEEVLVAFVGWHSRLDEWIALSSPRLAPLDSRSHGQRGSGVLRIELLAVAADQESLSALLQDREDDPGSVAVARNNSWLSQCLIDNVNFFGKLQVEGAGGGGGFDAVLLAVQAAPRPQRVMCLASLVTAVGRLAYILSRPFLVRFALQLCEALGVVLLSMDMEEELRAFGKDAVDAVVKAMERLLRRCGSGREAGRFVEDLRLRLAARFLRTALFTRRLDGVKLLVEMTRMAADAKRHPGGVCVVEGAESDLNRFDYKLVPVARGYEPHELAAWVDAQGLVGEVYDGKRWHDELVERFGEVARFLASERRLSEASLRVMWEAACVVDHGAQTGNQATSVLLGLCASLDTPALDWLVSAASMATSRSPAALEVIKAACIRAAGIARSTTAVLSSGQTAASAADAIFSRGLAVLWAACTGLAAAGSAPQVVALVKDVVVQSAPAVLGGVVREGETGAPVGPPQDVWEAHRARFEWLVQACVAEVRGDGSSSSSSQASSVDVALDVLQAVIFTFPSEAAVVEQAGTSMEEQEEQEPSCGGKLVRSSVIEWLQVSVGLLDLILASILARHELARRQAEDGQLLSSLGRRLGVLSCFCRASALTLGQEQVSQLWTALNRQAVSEGESTLFLRWLSGCMAGSGDEAATGCILGPGVPEWLLGSCLFDPLFITTAQSPASLHCLLRLVLCVGALKGYVQLGSGAASRSADDRAALTDFRVLALGLDAGQGYQLGRCLPGLDAVWLIFVHASNPDVVAATADFLTRLPRRFACPLDQDGSVGVYRSLLVHAALSQLSSAATEGADGSGGSSAMMMDRCVALLEAVVEEAAAEGYGVVRPHSCIRRGAPLWLNVNNSIKNSAKPPKFRVCMHGNDTSADLVSVIASSVQRRPQEIRVFRAGKELGEAQRSCRLTELGLRDEEALLLCLRVMPGASKDVDASGSTSSSKPVVVKYQSELPSVLLASSRDNFDLLFRVMGTPGTSQHLTHRIWRLLMRLPTSPDLYQQMLALALPCASLLPAQPPIPLPKLLYCLQLIEYLLDPGEADPHSQDSALLATWPVRFVVGGGPTHLQRLLVEHEGFACLLLVDGAAKPPLVSEVVGTIARVLRRCLSDNQAGGQGEAAGLSQLRELAMKLTTGWVRAPAELSAADGQAVVEVLQLWERLVLGQPLSSLLPSVSSFVTEVLLCSSSKASDVAKTIRAEMTRVLQGLSQVPPASESAALLLSMLIRHRPQQLGQAGSEEACRDYYALVEAMVGGLAVGEEVQQGLWQGWALELAAQVGAAGQVAGVPGMEAVLEGAAKVLTCMVRADPTLARRVVGGEGQQQGGHRLTTVLLTDLIFGEEGEDGQAPCREPDTRSAVYGLVTACCAALPEELGPALHVLDLHHNRVALPEEVEEAQQPLFPLPGQLASSSQPTGDSLWPYGVWNFTPAGDRRAEVGYQGLKNLGCICYMNALMQQLYMTPDFRAGILSAPALLQSDDPEAARNSLLEQARRMFQHLRWSERRAYNPRPWCYAFKDAAGQPTNVLVQQDAEEFLQALCDRLQVSLQSSPTHAKFVQGTIGGLLCNQLVLQQQEGALVRESDEPFYCIGLEVRHQGGLERSLTHFCQGQTVSGFKWDEQSDERVTILKRSCIRRTSDTLIFHLKRFEFNFDSMQQEKLNDRFHFPLELDLFPFTRDGLAYDASSEPAPTLLYELVGVVVHTGTADSGHYFSYIREREGEQRWLEFNDSTVKLYDSSKMEEDCFGGSTTVMEYDAQAKAQVERSMPISKSAYMLVYHRKKPAQQDQAMESVAAEGPAVEVPQEIRLDNRRHRHAIRVFAHEHAVFVSSLLDGLVQHVKEERGAAMVVSEGAGSSGGGSSLDLSSCCVMGCRYLVKILARSSSTDDGPLVAPMVKALLELVGYAGGAETARQLIAMLMKLGAPHEGGDGLLLVDVLLQCGLPGVRKAMADLLHGLLLHLADTDSLRLLDFSPGVHVAAAALVGDAKELEWLHVATEDPVAAAQLAREQCLSGVLVEVLLHTQLLHHVAVNWSRSGELLELLRAWAEARPEHRLFLLQGGVVAKLTDLFMGAASPIHNQLYPAGARNLPPASRSRPAKAMAMKNRPTTAPPMGAPMGPLASALVGPDWAPLLEIVTMLVVRHTVVRPTPEQQPVVEEEQGGEVMAMDEQGETDEAGGTRGSPVADGVVELSHSCRNCILAPAFHSALLANPPRYWRYFSELTCHVAREWLNYSNDVTQVLVNTLAGTEVLVEDLPYVMRCLGALLALPDSLQAQRISDVLVFDETAPFSIWRVLIGKARAHASRPVAVMLLCLRSMAQQQMPVARFLWETRTQWGPWTLEFLGEYLRKVRSGVLKLEAQFVPRGLELWGEGKEAEEDDGRPWIERVEALERFFQQVAVQQEGGNAH